MTNFEFIIRLIVAFLLGSALGFERQWRQRMAGLLTNTLVAVGACLFVMLSVLIEGDSSPSRISAQVVSGIGFLAGGVILREGLNVRGLNTAATLWCAAGIGTLSGSGYLSQAFIGSMTVLIAHLILPPLGELINEQPLNNTEIHLSYQCSVTCSIEDEIYVRALLLDSLHSEHKIKLVSVYRQCLDAMDVQNKVIIEAEIITKENNDQIIEKIINRLSLDSKVIAASWRVLEKEY